MRLVGKCRVRATGAVFLAPGLNGQGAGKVPYPLSPSARLKAKRVSGGVAPLGWDYLVKISSLRVALCRCSFVGLYQSRSNCI